MTIRFCRREGGGVRMKKTDKEILINNGETEITINDKAISVFTPDVSVIVMEGKNSTSVITKERTDCAVSAKSNALPSESH